MTQINAYLIFNGQCREAMTFYKNCLGGELNLQTVAESPMAPDCPAAMQQNILHSTLTNGGLVLLGSDMGPSTGRSVGNNVTLSLDCSSEEEINKFYKGLSDGGNADQPLHKFFAGMIGQLTDKYGVIWNLYYNNVPN